MKTRCFNPNDKHFKDYGGRGVTISDGWLGENGFANFLSDMGARPGTGYSIERRNSSGNYEPANCYWATSREQTRNYRRNVNYTINGVTKCLKDWCAEYGVNYSRTFHRIRRGWKLDDALTDKRDGRATRHARRLGADVETLKHEAKAA